MVYQKKVRKNFMLTQTLDKKIEDLSKKNNIPKSNIVERAVNYYIENEGRDYKGLYEVLNTMFQHIEKKIEKNTHEVKSIKSDTNIMIQLKNNDLLKGNIKDKDITLISEKESDAIKKIKKDRKKELQKKRTRKLEG